jgi:hypothetical protein
MEWLINEDLLRLEKELDDDDDDDDDVKPVKRLSTRHLTEFFKNISTTFGITDDNNVNRERSAEVTRGIESVVACCKELCSTSALSPGTHNM